MVIGLFGVTTTIFGFEELGYRPACLSGVIVERCRPVAVDVLLRVGLAVGLVVAYVLLYASLCLSLCLVWGLC